MLYPTGLDEGQIATVQRAIGGEPVSVEAARRVLGVLDQQVSSSPVTIRWGPDDLQFADVADVRLALDRADASVSVQIVEGAYEPHVAATLDRLLRPGDVFVDVGANIGYHTVRGARSVGSTGRVIAVEANPENARLIAHTIAVNALANVDLVPLALSADRGYMTFGAHLGSNGGFLVGDAASAASARGTLVPTLRMDDLGLDRVDVVKIDVEGAEALVIDGAAGLIERTRPTFVMEFSVEMTGRVSRRQPKEHLDRFLEWGYSIAIIDRETAEANPVESVGALLADWGELGRIEDLLVTPTGA